jgi:hypothetical protein
MGLSERLSRPSGSATHAHYWPWEPDCRFSDHDREIEGGYPFSAKVSRRWRSSIVVAGCERNGSPFKILIRLLRVERRVLAGALILQSAFVTILTC